MPVPPQSVNDYVVAFDGPRKTNGVLMVQELIAGGSQCVVSPVPHGEMFEVPTNYLVKIKKPDDL